LKVVRSFDETARVLAHFLSNPLGRIHTNRREVKASAAATPGSLDPKPVDGGMRAGSRRTLTAGRNWKIIPLIIELMAADYA
jgi:hypothetical protein